jgi:nucleotide-binding universal stress UspA family protein
MAGLLTPNNSDAIVAPPPEQPLDEPAEAIVGDDLDEAEPNVSQEDQLAYETFVTSGMKLLYEGGKPRPGILAMLDEDPSDLIAALGEQPELTAEAFGPAVALGATTAVTVLEVVRRNPEEAAVEGVLIHGGTAILEDIADLAQTAGIHEYTPEEVNNALLIALQFYTEAAQAEGLYDPETAQADLAEMQSADQEGRLFDMIPQLKQFSGGER